MNAIADAALEFSYVVGMVCLAIVTLGIGLFVAGAVIFAVWTGIKEAIVSFEKESRK